MKIYRKSLIITLIVIFALLVNVSDADAKGRKHKKHRRNHNKADVYLVHQAALDLTLAQINQIPSPALDVTVPTCEPFTDKDCATDLRYKIQ